MLLSFTKVFAANYYWVGGSGAWSDINHWRTTSGGTTYPSVVPGPGDNTFFDGGSGFIASSKTVTLDVTGNVHNITFSGSSVAPTFTQSGLQTLNIYGSSVWQSGMPVVNIANIYYRHTGEAKTITSNGVITGNSNIFLEEENSISLTDAFIASYAIWHQTGTFNTNGYSLTTKHYYANNGTKPQTLNLGSSNVYMTDYASTFNTNSSYITLNAGTSHIHFTVFDKANNDNYFHGLLTYGGQTFYNVTFENATSNGGGTLGGNHSGKVYFNKVEFKGDGAVYGDNQFKELVFSAGRTYTFPAGNTQTITSLFSANTPQCGGWSTISSGTSDTQANIVAAAGVTIDVRGAIMKDLNSSGGANFVANNSVNNGNNTGWTFPPYTGQNLYWVGGSGNWNDKSHWSQTTGGTGGYCVPGPGDNTFFDGGSGFTASSKKVTVDNISYTHNITFSGSSVAPTFTQSGLQTLNIYGSSVWQSVMPVVNITNIYYRHTGEAKTITSNGVIMGNSNIFLEEENSISLTDAFIASYAIWHQTGTFNTNGYSLTTKHYYANNGTKPQTLNLGSSNVYMTDYASTFNTNSSYITLNAGTSHIHFTVFDKANNDNYFHGLLTYEGQTFYNVTFENATSNGGGTLGGNHSGKVYFNKVEFKGDGAVYGDNQFKELVFSAGRTYTFPAGNTQIITSLFSANTPQCGGWSTISSGTSDTQANIVAAAGVTIDVRGAIMKDLNSSGGASFVANNSVNNGNNTGWTFPPYTGQNLYWVGGSGNWNDKSHWSQTTGGTGGYCVPGPGDNTFFDGGSGFTASSKKVTVDNISYTHNITFSGSSVAPTFTQSGLQTLNIYGSSVWQSGMPVVNITNIYYRHTGEAKTITSNGVIMGNSNIFLEEENSISLTDAFIASYAIWHQTGTFNTNGYSLTTKHYYANNGTKPQTLNLGSSNVYMTDYASTFNTNSSYITLNAGTSHIHFTVFDKANNDNYFHGLLTYEGQTFYNVTFENATSNGGGTLGGNHSGKVYFNKVEFKGDGAVYGDNQFKELVFSTGRTYTLQMANTQTTESWILGGTPCTVTYVQSSTSGTRANINVTGGNTNFNFGNLKDINASGQPLHFGSQSTIANQNNNNITYDPYDPGVFQGLGPDWQCHVIDNTDASTYTLSTSAFYGNSTTIYSWYKLNDSNYDSSTPISTASSVDIRLFGYGTYKVEVSYTNGAAISCTVSDEVNIIKKTDPPIATSNVCKKETNTIGDISISGNNIKWYPNNLSTAELPSNTTILNGETYFASQTINNCESKRTAITVIIVNCNNVPSMINPSLPIRTY
ncbi:hypothetical protein H5J24_15415 [Chryseobacterium capnotolerans]|uniref:hypothetical protein n=1 Tax=Chryseobacterium capnotolerans TaxID=2759528 RepID=UPI001E5E73D4|nr:hypothetical protein [Chryseobacterium capnotolerans]UHO37137.1 hypothetical protein H5J24_15415 [Chryseobacterium capnotolerans]